MACGVVAFVFLTQRMLNAPASTSDTGNAVGLGQRAARLQRWVANRTSTVGKQLGNAEARLINTLSRLAQTRRGDYVPPGQSPPAPVAPTATSPPRLRAPDIAAPVPPPPPPAAITAVSVAVAPAPAVAVTTVAAADAGDGDADSAYGEVVAITRSMQKEAAAVATPATPSSAHLFKGAQKVKQYAAGAAAAAATTTAAKPTVTAKGKQQPPPAKPAPKAKHAPTKKKPVRSEAEEKGFEDMPENHKSHPHVSPRPGTDMSTEAQRMALLRCPNQSRCIVPELQLQKQYKVYYCRHPVRSGVRFYYLMREGLLLHPNVELVEEKDMHVADWVIYLPGSAPWHKTECTNVSLAQKMIVMDEFDGPSLFYPRPSGQEVIDAYGSLQWYFMYYKRSFVNRANGRFLGFPHFRHPDVYPMTYAVAEPYTQHQFNFQREIDILCTLRGSPQMPTRQRVQDWVAEYGQTRKVQNFISKQVNGASRTSVSKQYFEQMYNAQIIVTVNPAFWEGDFRLWESFATGALVFVDPLFVPHPNPLVDGTHVVYFDNENKTDLFTKLDYYRAHKDEARRIAVNGYLHTMKYHRTVSLVDYVLRSAHLKRAELDMGTPLPQYKFTAQYINKETKKQEKEIKKHRRPVSLHPHGQH